MLLIYFDENLSEFSECFRKWKTMWIFAELVAKSYENSLKIPNPNKLFIIQIIFLNIHSLVFDPPGGQDEDDPRRLQRDRRQRLAPLRELGAQIRVDAHVTHLRMTDVQKMKMRVLIPAGNVSNRGQANIW